MLMLIDLLPHARKATHSAQFWCKVSLLESTLVGSLVSAENKRLAETLSILESTLTKKQGVGGHSPS